MAAFVRSPLGTVAVGSTAEHCNLVAIDVAMLDKHVVVAAVEDSCLDHREDE